MDDPAVADKKNPRDRIIIGAALVVIATVLAGVPFIFWASEERREANESAAIATCKEIGAAQNMYHRTDWDNDRMLEYAPSFLILYSQRDAEGKEAKLISKEIAQATRPGNAYCGYYFVDITGDGAGAYVPGPSSLEEYGVCAVPASYPRSGRRTFIIDTTGTVYGKDNGGVPLTVFPASPRAAGWMIAE